MLALQYNAFIHDVDKLISLNSQLQMTKGGWGVLLLIADLTNQVDCSSAVK